MADVVYGWAERAQLCEDIGDALYRLITKVMDAEASVLAGADDAAKLLEFIHEGSGIIDHLEAVYVILEYSLTHGPGPYSEDELAAVLGHDRNTVRKVLEELTEQGIIHRSPEA